MQQTNFLSQLQGLQLFFDVILFTGTPKAMTCARLAGLPHEDSASVTNAHSEARARVELLASVRQRCACAGARARVRELVRVRAQCTCARVLVCARAYTCAHRCLHIHARACVCARGRAPKHAGVGVCAVKTSGCVTDRHTDSSVTTSPGIGLRHQGPLW